MTTEHPREEQRANAAPKRPTTRRLYRVRNWPEYNTALVGRGKLTVWADGATLAAWRNGHRTGERGRPRIYSDQAICCALTLAVVFGLPLRAVQGLIASLLPLLGRADLPVPHYSTLCRRRARLGVVIGGKPTSGPVRLVVDSTGLKVSGEGEWKVKKHGKDAKRRRVWRKAHLAVDADSHLIRAAVATDNAVADGTALPALLGQVDGEIASVGGDGGYDWRSCYEAITARGAKAVIPPRRGAVIWQHGNRKADPLDRDEALRLIRRRGRAEWKRQSGYHIRSLAETAMARLKGIFGDRLSTRLDAAQEAETLLRCAALNRMTELGMPKTQAVQVN